MISSKKFQNARLAIGVIASVCGLNISSQAFSAESATPDSPKAIQGSLVIADAHTYRHCHNLSKRTYCHKTDRLPQNWPPNSDTPHRSGYETDNQKECVVGGRRCSNGSHYSKG